MGAGEGVSGDSNPPKFPVMVHGHSYSFSSGQMRQFSEFSNALQKQTETFCSIILGRWVTRRALEATSEKA